MWVNTIEASSNPSFSAKKERTIGTIKSTQTCMSKDVKFNIKLSVDGKEQVVTASTNIKELASRLGITEKKAKGVESAFKSYLF